VAKSYCSCYEKKTFNRVEPHNLRSVVNFIVQGVTVNRRRMRIMLERRGTMEVPNAFQGCNKTLQRVKYRQNLKAANDKEMNL
jgi:hypothetical protein